MTIIEPAPRNGLCIDAKVIRVVDGDTIEVEVTRKFQVRITDEAYKPLIFDAPEKDTKLGKKAKKYVELLCLGQIVTIFIDSHSPLNFMDFNSFSRIIGEVWINEDPKIIKKSGISVRLTGMLVAMGFGRFIRKSKRKTTPWT